MTAIAPDRSNERELFYANLLDHNFTTATVDAPCECPHSKTGEHFGDGAVDCEEPASWRVTLDCRHEPPRHAFYFCEDCKNFFTAMDGVYSAERIK